MTLRNSVTIFRFEGKNRNENIRKFQRDGDILNVNIKQRVFFSVKEGQDYCC